MEINLLTGEFSVKNLSLPARRNREMKRAPVKRGTNVFSVYFNGKPERNKGELYGTWGIFFYWTLSAGRSSFNAINVGRGGNENYALNSEKCADTLLMADNEF